MNYENYEKILSSGDPSLHRLLVIAAAILGGALIRKDAQKWALDKQTKTIILCVVALGSILGSILPSFIAGSYVSDVAFEFLNLSQSNSSAMGLESLLGPKTILGGLLSGFFFVAIYKHLAEVHYDTSDAFARGSCLMMAIGRLGCIALHCCFGKITSGGFAYDFGDGHPRFPTQMVEAIFLFALFAFLNVLHQKNLYTGKRLFIFFSLYGSGRFVLEFYRESIADTFLGIGFYQWLSLLLLSVGLWQLVKRSRITQVAT